ncbi:MAG: metallophosphoesterase [Bryobacteraceae bacterium]|jgi:predicted MPP superfamily phosphohydrolase
MRSSNRWLPIIPIAAFLFAAAAPAPEAFHFVILGDRTGEPVPDVYEHVLADATSSDPAFVVTTGDTIQGLDDTSADAEWRQVEQILVPYRRFRLYLAPGNHDIWSEPSENLFRKYAGHPPHYSFDYGPAHFTILDNSRSDQFSPDELSFLERDLKAHASQPVKFIISHRPSWIFNVLAGNPDFPLHRLARTYGVQYVVAGHLHEMLHFKLEGIEYISTPSSGGHLRGSEKYGDGWFFGYAGVDVRKGTADFRIHQIHGSVTALNDWGPGGLVLVK